MKRIFYMAVKDLAVLMKDKGNLFWVFGFPILFALFFGMIFSGMSDGPSQIVVGVVDEDQTRFSEEFTEALRARESLEVITLSRADALERVRKGNLSCALFLNPGFGEGLGGFFSEERTIEMASDPARTMELGFLQGMIVQSLFEVMQSQFTNLDRVREQLDLWRDDVRSSSDPDFESTTLLLFFDALELMLKDVNELDTNGSESVMKLNLEIPRVEINRERQGPTNSFQITFPQAILWGILGCAATFAVSLVRERTVGTMQRLLTCPLSEGQILAGKGLACFLTCLFVVVSLFLVGWVFFKVPFVNIPLFFLGALCVMLCFVGVMMMVSTIGRTEQGVGGAGWAIMMVMSMLGGGMVPLVFMPDWLRPVSLISPVRWSIYVLEGGIWRELSFIEILPACGLLLLIGAVSYILGLWLMKRFHCVG
ncbi:MAG: ABC transporter permease [Lentisphaerae bacterium]|nr:ABC transporter permease [Lentisphaerota bacterium]